jgi:hypothetical protein
MGFVFNNLKKLRKRYRILHGIITGCNNSFHGVLYKDFKGEWNCLLCKEKIDYKELSVIRASKSNKVIVSIIKYIDKLCNK